MFKQTAIVCAFALGTIGAAQASTVSGNFNGTIDAPSSVSNPSIQYIGGGTNQLEWGAPDYWTHSVEQGNSSSLTVNNTDFDFSHADINSGSVLLGTITWNNQSNWHTGTTWSSNVNLDIDFVSPTALSLGQSIGFGITNTPDASHNTAVNESNGQNPDIISGMLLDVNAFGVPVKLGSGLALTSLYFDLVDAGSWSFFESGTGHWSNGEGGTSTIGIYGEVSAVPLPAGVWLMLGGLGSLAAARRRKKAAA